MKTLLSKTLKLAAVVAAATFTLAACGTTSDTGSSTTSSSSQADSTHDDADVSFAQDMIPHHAQAVVMAKMAQTQASDPEVTALAADIEAAQGPEIEQMSGWLTSWGEEVPATDGGAMGGMGTGEMPGMMTGGQMSRLGKASGADFDRMWLQMMIRHHQGAVEMAKAEQRDGRNPDAVALAKRIEAAQTAEISRMQERLGV